MKQSAERTAVFRLNPRFANPAQQRLFGLVRGPLQGVLAFKKLEAVYTQVLEAGERGGDFLNNTLRALNIEYDVREEDLAKIPREGPVVVVGNHPFGGIEGIILLAVLRSVREDAKVLANHILTIMPEMREYGFYVDPFGLRDSPRRNVRPMKEALRWIREGHLLAAFPAGAVSHIHLRQRRVCDPPWNDSVTRLIMRTQAPVLPVFFEGRNGNLFQLVGMLHPRCRTALLPRELLNKRSSCIHMRVGRLIGTERMLAFEEPAQLTAYLRFRTYLLASREEKERQVKRRRFPAQRRKAVRAVAEPQHMDRVREEVLGLCARRCLTENDKYAVCLARAPEIPYALREIGRLREITFRAVGEGTGRALDLDRFDDHYMHIILWSKECEHIAGAYRVARTEEVLSRYGKHGLYTSTLFRYGRKLLRQIGPSLELGRSFVREEHQRNYSSLMMLWKGIGCVAVQEPVATSLFGPVSINDNYNSMSRQLMVSLLEINHSAPELVKLARSRHKMRAKPMLDSGSVTLSHAATDVEHIAELISEIEGKPQGIPILLRQYLRLGGKLLSFNVDPEFSDVLDGLIWVDLLGSDPRMLRRFMGPENAEIVLRQRRVGAPA